MESSTGIERRPVRIGSDPDVPRSATRLVALLGGLLVVSGVLLGIQHDWLRLIVETQPFDFDINLVGAHRLVGGVDVYNRAASHVDAIEFLGPSMRRAFTGTNGSFIGMPVVALLHVPFLALPHAAAIAVMRVLNVVGVIASLVLVARLLPRGNRLPGLTVGLGAMLLSVPLVLALGLGQLHGLVTLGLAATIWGVARDRPWIAGIGLGIAIAFKLAPALLFVYLLLRGYRRVFVPTVATVAALCALAAAIGPPTALLTWMREVLPSVSGGSRYAYNQSLPAWISRLTSSSSDFTHHVSLGPDRFWSVVVIVCGIGVLWRRCRGRRGIAPLELAAVVLVLLLAGPLSWNHYYVWALLPIVLLCDVRLWCAVSRPLRAALVVLGVTAIGCLADRIHQFTPREVLLDPGLRLSGSPYVFGALLLFCVSMTLVWPEPEPGEQTPEFAARLADQDAPVGAGSRRVGLKAGHAGDVLVT